MCTVLWSTIIVINLMLQTVQSIQSMTASSFYSKWWIKIFLVSQHHNIGQYKHNVILKISMTRGLHLTCLLLGLVEAFSSLVTKLSFSHVLVQQRAWVKQGVVRVFLVPTCKSSMTYLLLNSWMCSILCQCHCICLSSDWRYYDLKLYICLAIHLPGFRHVRVWGD